MKSNFIKKYSGNNLNFYKYGTTFLLILLIFILPYWLFEGKYFIGGDDSRFFYIYPELWINNVGFYSWYDLQGYGFENPQQFSLPFLSILSIVKLLLPNLQSVSYFAFSLPLVIGFLYLRKLLNYISSDFPINTETYLTSTIISLLYIFSPIIWGIAIPLFIYSVFVIAIFPAILFYFIRFIKTGAYTNVIYAYIFSIIFSIGFIAIPWILGGFLPFFIGAIIYLSIFYKKIQVIILFKKSTIFFIAILFSQLFWLLPFIRIFRSGQNNISLSPAVQDTFTPTIEVTMGLNNIIYPILDLFHRSIVMEFDWNPLKYIYLNFYDYTIYFNLLIPIIIFSGIIITTKYGNQNFKNKILYIILVWIISLWFFTVNLGIFKEIFLLFKYIPGIGMFRNAYDKFSIGYAFIYSILIFLALLALIKIGNEKFIKSKYVILFLVSLLIFLNSVPIKKYLNNDHWKMDNYSKNIIISDEAKDFLLEIKNNKNINGSSLSIPFGYASYLVIKDEISDNAFIGLSPVGIFGMLNNYSGFLSIKSELDKKLFYDSVMKNDNDTFERMIDKFNIKYFIFINDVPNIYIEKSYYFASPFKNEENLEEFNIRLKNQVLSNNIGNLIYRSKSAKFEIYKVNFLNRDSQNKIHSYKISPIEYVLNLAGSESSIDIFNLNQDWLLVPDNLAWYRLINSKYLFNLELNLKTGEYVINRSKLDQFNLDNNLPINQKFKLYYYPQVFFYLGILFSFFGFLVLLVLIKKQTRLLTR